MKQKIIFVSQGLSLLVEQEHDASPLTETGTLVERRVDASFLFPPSLAEQSVFVSCQEPLSSSPLLTCYPFCWHLHVETRSHESCVSKRRGKEKGDCCCLFCVLVTVVTLASWTSLKC
jgi:hypothetical protein